MALFTSPADFTEEDEAQNKVDLKSQVTLFIGQPTSTKIEISRTTEGYHAEFTGDSSPTSPGTGVDQATTAAFAALDDASKTKITMVKQSNGNWTVTS
ncbi:hypothetical protein [Bradyrhizobium sp. SHOUNA76]|uniref:hypothetical protein n=1 Tax=Bradyrhizobium sp. SHOUNA76 TaxID=2908927 RepID=UPI001FF4312D|nr:hypothetical protein [Bradyrhizobium sp. SHOUNA76]MCJ9701862.1 hypothetical protein [Bradyrhizobium sp. SHOUNA76]